jgi:hypothetical protein
MWIKESARQGVCIPIQNYQSTLPEPTNNGEQGIWELGAAGRDGATRPRSRQQVSLSSSQGSTSSAVRGERLSNPRNDPPSQQATTPVTTARRATSDHLSSAGLLSDMRWLAPSPGIDRPPTRNSEAGAQDLADQLDQSEETCDPASGRAARGIFHGSLFLVSPRIASSAELASIIEEGGGKVLLAPPQLADRPADYDVRRLGAPEDGRASSTPEAASGECGGGGGGGGGGGFGRPKRQLSQSRLAVRGRVVSEYWVRKCLAVGKVLDPEVLLDASVEDLH